MDVDFVLSCIWENVLIQQRFEHVFNLPYLSFQSEKIGSTEEKRFAFPHTISF